MRSDRERPRRLGVEWRVVHGVHETAQPASRDTGLRQAAGDPPAGIAQGGGPGAEGHDTNVAPSSAAARRPRLELAVCGLLALAGCAGPGKGLCLGWTDRDGVGHALVLGFGVVSCKEQPGLSAVDAKIIGFVLDGGLSGGIVQRHLVEIDPEAAGNAVVSIRSTPFGMTIKNFEIEETEPASDAGTEGGSEIP